LLDLAVGCSRIEVNSDCMAVIEVTKSGGNCIGPQLLSMNNVFCFLQFHRSPVCSLATLRVICLPSGRWSPQVFYSLRFILLDTNIDLSRHILVINTSTLVASYRGAMIGESISLLAGDVIILSN
jgi:hypothetical protein